MKQAEYGVMERRGMEERKKREAGRLKRKGLTERESNVNEREIIYSEGVK